MRADFGAWALEHDTSWSKIRSLWRLSRVTHADRVGAETMLNQGPSRAVVLQLIACAPWRRAGAMPAASLAVAGLIAGNASRARPSKSGVRSLIRPQIADLAMHRALTRFTASDN